MNIDVNLLMQILKKKNVNKTRNYQRIIAELLIVYFKLGSEVSKNCFGEKRHLMYPGATYYRKYKAFR